MEICLQPGSKNIYPIAGILIRGASVESWLAAIQEMRIRVEDISTYPLPSNKANIVWGCMIAGNFDVSITDIGPRTWLQLVHRQLFIPEMSVLFPRLSADEISALLHGRKHLLHPEIGLVELEEELDWTMLIRQPGKSDYNIRQPHRSIHIPAQIKTFQIQPVQSDALLQSFEEKNFPGHQKFSDKPLNPFEQIKLFFYRQLFTSASDEQSGSKITGKTKLLSKLERLKNFFSKKETSLPDNMQQDYEELERRSQKHIDRLMDLFKKDPKEALKYAIPLDNTGAGRGGFGSFTLQKRWFDFSLFGGGSGAGAGTAVLSDDSYSKLHQQYTNAAEELIKRGDYRGAAFVYIKLLKNYYQAAETLSVGGFYGEAAAIYLKYCNNKLKAAECYEKGNMITSAIELYKEMGDHEKVGDLYQVLNKRPEAMHHYQKVADNYNNHFQYIKASLLYKNKMHNQDAAQETLLTGWRQNKDAYNCLLAYYANISDPKQLEEAIKNIYQKELAPANLETFLRVLQKQYQREEKLSQMVRDLAYEIVAGAAKTNPGIVSELRPFNSKDKQFTKDSLRFRVRPPSSKES